MTGEIVLAPMFKCWRYIQVPEVGQIVRVSHLPERGVNLKGRRDPVVIGFPIPPVHLSRYYQNGEDRAECDERG